jgi:CheY-like chemotaxis protein
MTPGAKANLLIVDDEPSISLALCHILIDCGYSVRAAEDGFSALAKIRQEIPDILLSDINMPGMSGLEMLPKAKALRPDVPVIMITAYGDAETKQKALANGAEALLTKPIDFALLRNEIDTRVPRAA